MRNILLNIGGEERIPLAPEYQWKVVKDLQESGECWEGRAGCTDSLLSDRQMIDPYPHQPATTDTHNYFNIYTTNQPYTPPPLPHKQLQPQLVTSTRLLLSSFYTLAFTA